MPLHQKLHREFEKRLKLSDSSHHLRQFGRPWREGLTEVAIGVAGMKALHDYRGQRDPHGYPLRVTVEAVADELLVPRAWLRQAGTHASVYHSRDRYRRGRGRLAICFVPQRTICFADVLEEKLYGSRSRSL